MESAGLPTRAVLHVIETGGPGGAERMVVHLASGLGPEYRSEAALIRDSWLGMALRKRGIPVTMLGGGPHGSLDTLRDLLRVIRDRQVAVLHTHEFFMNTVGVFASWLTRVPVVATVHGKNYYPDRFRRRAAYRLVGKLAGQVVAVSEDVRRFLAERIGIPVARIRVVPNGVPVDEEPSQEQVSALRTSLDLDQQSTVVGTVGSLYPVKGHAHLIDAATLVLRRFPRAVFLIAGRGGLQEELQAQTRQLGIAHHFRFPGYRDDVRQLLALFDVFVLPSLSEGMPLALLEAMAAGVPCVATTVGGVNEIVEDAKTGMLVPPADAQALAESVVTLLQDRALAFAMGENARKTVASRFSLTGMVKAYQEIYTTLLRKRDGI